MTDAAVERRIAAFVDKYTPDMRPRRPAAAKA